MDETTRWILGLIVAALVYLILSDHRKDKKLVIIETIVTSLQTRFDLFIKSETDGLKKIVEENTDALQQIARK